MSEFAIIAYSAATQYSTLRRKVIVLLVNAPAWRICCYTALDITSLRDRIMSECAIIAHSAATQYSTLRR